MQPDYPNLYFCSAPKTGSYALWYQLGQHPDILMSSIKEPGLFLVENPNEEEIGDYRSYFSAWNGESVIGEASLYLCGNGIPARVAKASPDAKLLFCYRNPILRALSHYQYRRGRGDYQGSFNDAVSDWNQNFRHVMATGDDRKGFCIWHSLYGTYTEKWLEHFPGDQCLFFRQEDYEQDNGKHLEAIFSFLGVREDVTIANKGTMNTTPPTSSEFLSSLSSKVGFDWNYASGHFNRPTQGQAIDNTEASKAKIQSEVAAASHTERKSIFRSLSPENLGLLRATMLRQCATLNDILGPEFPTWDIDQTINELHSD